MRGLLLFTLVVAFLFAPVTAQADGLLYKLPADGTSATFRMEVTVNENGMQKNLEGKMTMSSVGIEMVDDEKCRWIEVKFAVTMNGQELTNVAKLLIPEKQLLKGKEPLKNVKRAWVKLGDQEAKELIVFDGRDAGPLPAFLAGPLKDEQKLIKETVDSKLGKLECEGITGILNYKQASDENEVFFETRLHEKAPFGVVTAKLTFNVTWNGQQNQTINADLNLTEVKKGVTTELPNNN